MENTKENNIQNKEYVFVFFNDGWWLKINSIDDLMNYHEKNDNRWARIFKNIINSKEYGSGDVHITKDALAVALYGQRRQMSTLDAVMNFKVTVITNQLNDLEECGEIYINCNGGYCMKTPNSSYEQFVRRKKLLFPDYNENDIRISQFPMGTHFYVHIGDMELKENDKIKWDTYEEAKAVAMRYVNC